MARILIMDDDAQLRKMLRQTLECAGYGVDEATDGMEGMKIYRQEPTDLIITIKNKNLTYRQARSQICPHCLYQWFDIQASNNFNNAHCQ